MANKAEHDQVRAQHEKLHRLVDDLRQFLKEPRPALEEQASHDWAGELSDKLVGIHGTLFRHFRAEERSGMFEAAVRQFPHSTRAVEVLRLEHDRILRDLGAILGSAVLYGEGKAPQNTHLRRWVESVLEQLELHEKEEVDLLQRLQVEDLGTKD